MLLASLGLLAACSSGAVGRTESTAGAGLDNRIVIRTDDVVGAFDRRLLGTNVPAWLLPELVADPEFRDLTLASGTTLLRLPGGSWSSNYHWLGCELADPQRCDTTWAMRPSDFLGLLKATGLPAMWTVSFNGTAQEAAALVAFFNGRVDDDHPIGTDRNGFDWMTVGHWARLRAERGYPEPMPIRYWEIGNEVYGAKSAAGKSCASYGWEDVWTCDPSEYVNGNADHDGYLQFRDAMRAVDADIDVGAVGVGARGTWSDWDDTVMGAARDAIDFYVIHHYGSNGEAAAEDVFDRPARDWPAITKDVRDGYADHGIGNDVPIAVTEHNLVAFIDGDKDRLMTMAVNAFYLAQTIGQMAENGVTIANQWNLANGRAENGSDYGLFDAQSHQRSPAYYSLALWARFGDQLVATDVGAGLDQLGVYGGRGADGSARLLVINPSSDTVGATIAVEPAAGAGTVTADVVAADSLTSTDVTFNGSTTPSIGLDEPGQVLTLTAEGELSHQFAPYSITLLQWNVQS